METPSVEEVMAAYDQLAQEHQKLINEYNALKQDDWKNRFDVVMRILEHRDYYKEDILKLAHWHLKKMLAKNELGRNSETID